MGGEEEIKAGQLLPTAAAAAADHHLPGKKPATTRCARERNKERAKLAN